MCGTVLNAALKHRISAHLLEQAGWNEGLGSPFTAALLRAMNDDLQGDGPVWKLCAGWTGHPRKDALGLRILGALHHAVLTGQAAGLATVFPPNEAARDIQRVWAEAKSWIEDNLIAVRQYIQSPPQTNETRRSIALLPGFLALAAQFDMPMHLLEIGASAGLNQNWDRFGYQTASWTRPGDSEVLIKTDWQGPVPAHLDVIVNIGSRAACDLNPLNVSAPGAARRLKSYVWPDQPDRLQRLDAAIAVAVASGTQVEQADAEAWLIEKLTQRPATGLTVVYHSVFLTYPPKAQIKRIMNLIAKHGAGATSQAPLAWLCYESEGLFGGDLSSPQMQTRVQVWPG
ncbi:MAG: DUF2332 domain-containing protein, partial [Henriciella sp.]|nr:DUF2332 domain-containing protein [Henriciella sp.]